MNSDRAANIGLTSLSLFFIYLIARFFSPRVYLLFTDRFLILLSSFNFFIVVLTVIITMCFFGFCGASYDYFPLKVWSITFGLYIAHFSHLISSHSSFIDLNKNIFDIIRSDIFIELSLSSGFCFSLFFASSFAMLTCYRIAESFNNNTSINKLHSRSLIQLIFIRKNYVPLLFSQILPFAFILAPLFGILDSTIAFHKLLLV